MDFTELSLSKSKIYKKKLLDNIQTFKSIISRETSFMAVIKANAYGHGAVELAQFMEEKQAADYFGLAQLGEALELRKAGIKTPILLFNAIRLSEIDLAIKNKISLTVFSAELALAIVNRAESLQKEALVHLKIDSGMGRIGICQFSEAYKIYQILNSPSVTIEGIYTHFADATNQEPHNFTEEQFNVFKKIVDQFEEKDIHFNLVHACNTAATINFPEYHLDMVRVGIGLYGFNPNNLEDKELNLQPIQNVKAKVTHIKDFPAGHSIGYGRNFFSTEPMRVATIGIGYADGLPKALSNKGCFRYQGKKLPIVGDICMDQIMIDSSQATDLKVGDYLNYFGDPAEGYSSAEKIAQLIDSSSYELLCALGRRIDRSYE